MKQITVTFNVDEEKLLESSGQDVLSDAIQGELSWLYDSGLFVENWSFVSPEMEKEEPKDNKVYYEIKVGTDKDGQEGYSRLLELDGGASREDALQKAIKDGLFRKPEDKDFVMSVDKSDSWVYSLYNGKNISVESWDDMDKKYMIDRDHMEVEIERKFVEDCYKLYEKEGFSPVFWSPYSELDNRIGQKFEVVKRLDDTKQDLCVLPMWEIKFEDGFVTDAYPEEIIPSEMHNNGYQMPADKKMNIDDMIYLAKIRIEDAASISDVTGKGIDSNLVQSVAHYAQNKEMEQAILSSDALRQKTLAICSDIPGYEKLPLKEKNKLYDEVKNMLSSQTKHKQNDRFEEPER